MIFNTLLYFPSVMDSVHGAAQVQIHHGVTRTEIYERMTVMATQQLGDKALASQLLAVFDGINRHRVHLYIQEYFN